MKGLPMRTRERLVLQEVRRLDPSVQGEAWIEASQVAAKYEGTDVIELRSWIRRRVSFAAIDRKRKEGRYSQRGVPRATVSIDHASPVTHRGIVVRVGKASRVTRKPRLGIVELPTLEELRSLVSPEVFLALATIANADRIQEAAKRLGVSRTNLWRWLRLVRECVNGDREWHALETISPRRQLRASRTSRPKTAALTHLHAA